MRILVILCLITAHAWAHDDVLVIPVAIPCAEPIPEPEIPYGCTRQFEVSATALVDDLSALQFWAGRWGEDVSYVRVIDQSQCAWTWDERWQCAYVWQVPDDAWFWQWAINQVPIGAPKCVHG